jgi:alanine-glyoxylate transaminase / (R)-3-amino-2-methylpropionate-pyruvate transaminase
MYRGRSPDRVWSNRNTLLGIEMQDVIPDIVTMAKGIRNGCPLGAVVTTPKIAQTLRDRLHFNTFGGNPVACAQGSKLLDIIERENMQANKHRQQNSRCS